MDAQTQTRIETLERRVALLFKMHRCSDAYQKLGEAELTALVAEFTKTGKEVIAETSESGG